MIMERGKRNNKILTPWVRLAIVALILVIGGLVYGFAGPKDEWGTIQIAGIVLIAIFFPWELFLLRKKKNKENE